ncbi:AraC family transcriptional regulator [Roseibium sp. SCP14]|uniref:AraC family transcriptional regulator n=1 Tax=Roseibium sp. SCP14 TaxID=3141375 RepID=UPI003338DE1F
MSRLRQRFAKVLERIEVTLEDPLDMAELASSASCSMFHFQRQFSAFVGVSVSDYSRLLRLKRAGQQLAFRRNLSITDIAFDAGYENLESFSRAFKRIFGQRPSEFRIAADWTLWHQTYDPLIELKGSFMPEDKIAPDNVRIIEFPETLVAALEHKGPQAGLTASAQKFIAWRRELGLSPARSATFNILYDDPKTTAPAEFRFDFCCEVTAPMSQNASGVMTKTIPGGLCAVLRHQGSLDFAEGKIRSLYRDWLPESGHELRDFPLFVKRLTFFPDVPEHEAEAEIFLPLQ